MLAYVFWHRPYAHADPARYEDAMLRFHRALADGRPPGFVRGASFAIEPVPWLGDRAGYEDWYLIEGSWAMEPLNAFAIAGATQAPHDTVAALMEQGHGGLYGQAGGTTVSAPRTTIYWMTRPRGIVWQTAIEALRGRCAQADIWRRQMVLGPAPEFAVEVPGDMAIDIPSGWQARSVKRVRLPRAAA